MTIDRYAEVLRDRSVELGRTRRKPTETQSEVEPLYGLLAAAAEGGQAWRTQRELVNQVKSQRKTIAKMSERIRELGGGRQSERGTSNAQ
jgi:hypothetical protein